MNIRNECKYSTVPTSAITAKAVTVDGFALSQKDTAGVVTTFTRSYTANGMVLTQTDGRGNTTTTVADKAGRALMVTDAASSGQSSEGATAEGNVTTTVYCDCCDQPATVTDAQGNTTCYRYDDAGNMVALTTYRGAPATNADAHTQVVEMVIARLKKLKKKKCCMHPERIQIVSATLSSSVVVYK